jgi:expansin (peptidoglycan-binding protein)
MVSRIVIAVLIAAAFAACGGEDTSETPPRGTPSTDAGTEASSPSSADGSIPADCGGGDSGDAALAEEFEGEATYYDANGTGACGFAASTDFMVAAINDEQYSKANCGRCIEVTGPLGKVVVRIVDKCPGCSHGDVDLSQTAFGKIAKLADGRVDITWHFVGCP